MKKQQREDNINFRVQPPQPPRQSATRLLWWTVAAIAVVSTLLVVIELREITALQHAKNEVEAELVKTKGVLKLEQAAKEKYGKENEGLKKQLDSANASIDELKKSGKNVKKPVEKAKPQMKQRKQPVG